MGEPPKRPSRQEVEEAVNEWLRGHYSVITEREGRDVGASYDLMRWKVTRGEWDRPCSGVFRSVSAPRTAYQDTRVAYVATRGLVADASATFLWDLLSKPPEKAQIRIPRNMHKPSQSLPFIVRQSNDLDLSTGSTRYGVLVTKPARSLVDLAATGTQEQLVEAVNKALVTRLLSVDAIEAEIARRSTRGRMGAAQLRQLLAEEGYLDAPLPSALEARLRRLVRRLGIRQPVPEVVAGEEGQYRLDLAWQEILFAIEVDGFAWHHSPEQKRRDELRRQRLREAGWTLLVFDWWQLTKQAVWVASEICTTYQRLMAEASQ